ncbi:MAG: peptide-binding protein [Armatimonadota bacterium]
MKGKNIIIIILILLIAFIFMGYKQGWFKTSSDKTQVLNLAIKSNPRTINPVMASDGTSMALCNLIFNPLVKFNENMEITGSLAEGWEISKDKKTWTFFLRKDVRWHDGTPFTARDVKFTFDKLYDENTNTFNRGMFIINNKPVDVKVIDDYKVQFTLPEVFAPFETYLTMLGIVPEHLLKDADINKCEFNNTPVGTGPYKLQAWHQGDKIILEANKDYFDGSPKIQQIVYKIMPSREAGKIALQRQEIDIYSPLDEQDLKTLNEYSFLKKYEAPEFDYYYLAFDLTNPVFKDIDVRRAINHAIDKEKLLNNVAPGMGDIINGPMPKASWAYTDNVIIYNYDPKKAEELLEKSGYKKGSDGIYEKDGKKLEFEIMYLQTNPRFHKIGVLIQSFLNTVGIKASLRSYETNVMYDKSYPGKFEAVIWDWFETPDPDCYTEWHSSQSGDDGMNYLSYSNPKVDKLLEQARTTYDRGERKKLYIEFQQIVSEDAAYVFLWSPRSVSGVNTRLKGYGKENPMGIFIYPEKLYLEKK